MTAPSRESGPNPCTSCTAVTTDSRPRALLGYPQPRGRPTPGTMFYGPFDYPGRRPDGPWHEDETLALVRAWRRGDSLDELSERHHRPVEAILSRLRDRGAIDTRPAPAAPRAPAFGLMPGAMPVATRG